MAGRITKEAEDIAYSMLGIFGVNVAPLYGEGTKAFIRLQRTLMESSSDESIFAWTAPPGNPLAASSIFDSTSKSTPYWGLLAPSPSYFKNSGNIVILRENFDRRLNGGYH